jgi:hypothetical protein
MSDERPVIYMQAITEERAAALAFVVADPEPSHVTKLDGEDFAAALLELVCGIAAIPDVTERQFAAHAAARSIYAHTPHAQANLDLWIAGVWRRAGGSKQ